MILMVDQPKKGNARSSGYDPVDDEWYAEMPEAVDAVLDVEKLRARVAARGSAGGADAWDPAAGGGNIQARCINRGIVCAASDIVDRGCGAMMMDFLTDPPTGVGDFPLMAIISNPPFSLTQQFVDRALTYSPEYIIMFQRLLWLEGKARAPWFQRTGLSRVWVFAGRQRLAPRGVVARKASGSIAYAWFVWERGHRGPPTLGWLP